MQQLFLSPNQRFFWYLAAMLMIIMGLRLVLIGNYGNPMPFWDQWDAQAGFLFPLWIEGQLGWQELFIDHNSHRIVFSRLLSLGLFILNENQWDPLVEMSVNVGLAAINFLLVVAILVRLLGREAGPLIVFAIGFLWVLPYSYENILSAFHSMWFLLVFFSLLAFWGVILHRPQQWQWWLGMFSGFVAFFNLAGGLFTVMALVVIALYGLITDRCNKSRYFWQAVVASILSLGCIVLVILSHQYNPGLATPSTPIDLFAQSLLVALSFPWDTSVFINIDIWQRVLLIAFLQLPVVILALRPWWHGQPPSLATQFILTLAVWTAMQAVAMAYVRPNLGLVASRYTDVLVFNLIANWLAIYLLLKVGLFNNRPLKKLVLVYGITWTCIVVVGLLQLTYGRLVVIYQNKSLIEAQITNTTAFIRSGNLNFLRNKPPLHIPYPDPTILAMTLAKPHVRNFLPSFMTLQEVLPTHQSDGSFQMNGFYPLMDKYENENVIGSYTQQGNLAQGTWVSRPRRTFQSYVKIPLVGYWFMEGMALQFVGIDSDRVLDLQQICKKPSQLPPEVWISCVVPIPERPFRYRVVATDNRPDYWFAFGSPRSLGTPSYVNQVLLQNSIIILILGIAMLVIMLPITQLRRLTLSS